MKAPRRRLLQIAALVGLLAVSLVAVRARWGRSHSSEANRGEPFADTFDRPTLGDDYHPTAPESVRIENGALVVEKAHNRPTWLKRPLPANGVIELDVWTDDPRGDIKLEAWGDGRSAYSGDLRLQYTASGYVLIFGGWNNSASVIARQWEHAPGQPTRSDVRVQPGRRYHFRIEKRGGTLEWRIDGQPFLTRTDPTSLGGQHLGLSGWETKVHFDNLLVTPEPVGHSGARPGGG